MSASEQKKPTSRILGTAFEVPRTVISNDALAQVMDTSHEWIEKRSGICERRYVDDGEGSLPLAERAALKALEQAGLEVSDIDLLLCATLSPDVDFPGNSALLQERLGMVGIPAMDIRNQCAGFVYGLSVADLYVSSGGAKNVLLVGAEVHSSGLEFNDRGRGVTALFGDGAGAAVIGPADGDHGLLEITLGAEGRFADKLYTVGSGHRRKPRIDMDVAPPESGYMFCIMNGRYVFKHAVERMIESIRVVLERRGLTVADLSIIIPHQANLRINQFVAQELELREDQVANNIAKYGNTTAATIPILLTETLAAGRIEPGDLVCIVAFGAGFTWGGALYRW